MRELCLFVGVDSTIKAEKFPELETPRLRLIQLTEDHAEWYLHHFSLPEIVHGQGFPAPKDIDAARKELDTYVIDLFKRGAGFRWGIVLRKDEKDIIGSCGFYRWVKDQHNSAQIGYDLRRQFWGQGIMSEALSEMLRFGFEEMDLHRVQVLIWEHNSRSIRLVERLGFTLEGVLRDNTYYDGAYQNDLIYSMLRDEWEKKRSR